MEPDEKVKLARANVPVSDEYAYLDTGSVGPVSRTYADALARCTNEDLRLGRAHTLRFDRIDRAKERIRTEVAAAIGASAGELELARSTIGAIQMLLERFPWESGDEIVSTRLEFPGSANALREIASERRLRLRIADVPGGDVDDVAWLEPHITTRTRLIAVSGVGYATGQRLPLDKISALAQAHGILTLVDGAQLVGASKLDLRASRIDFVAMPMQKWLCGPEGLGALYARAGSLNRRRRENVTHGWPVLEATAEHLAWLREALDWSWIDRRTRRLSTYARTVLGDITGTRLVTPETRAGLVSVAYTGDEGQGIADRLNAQRIVARHRPELNLLRISTAFFNTEDEIDRFAASIR